MHLFITAPCGNIFTEKSAFHGIIKISLSWHYGNSLKACMVTGFGGKKVCIVDFVHL
jgi:hypothetical protein